jgi:hypothetical protein
VSSHPRIINDNNSYGEMGCDVPGMRMIALSHSGFAVFCARLRIYLDAFTNE